ncbi:MAG: MFS transporter [Acidobacteria bacterium]|nr:MFS transporter [Acidobacteriota bacterium]
MDAGKTKNSVFFYGWIIVAIGVLALIVSNGLSIGGIPVFYKFVQGDLVASGAVPPDKIQSVYGLAPALTFLLAGFLSPVAGFLLQRFNARLMMLIGCFILGSGLLIYSQAASPIMVYSAHILLGASLGFVGVLVSTVLVSNWFVKKRGLALGIVLTGTSFGGAIIPQISTPLIQGYGWRTAMMLISLIIWVILLPAVIFLVKNRPEDLGLLPDGQEPIIEPADRPAKPVSVEGVSLAEAIATPVFWLFSFCAALIFYAIFVVSQQLNLYLQGTKIGFTPQQASNVQSLLFILSVAGKFFFGWLADRFPGNRVMLISACTMFLATLFFLYFNATTVYFFAVLFGLNYGGTFVLLQLLVADYFGIKEYGKILGVVTVVETVGGALGTFLTGKIADANGGDYTQAFYGITVVVGLAFVLVILLNLFLNHIRRPFWLLPMIFTPLIGALVGVIGGPVLNEVGRVVLGANIVNLVLPAIVLGLIIGAGVGIWSGLSVKKAMAA